MKKLFGILLSFIILSPTSSWAQQTDLAMDQVQALTNNPTSANNHFSAIGRDIPPSERKGTGYLYEDWRTGNLYLKKNIVIDNYPLMYNVEENQIEIRYDEGGTIKVLEARRIDSLVMYDELQFPHYFVNALDYKVEKTPLVGLLEVLTEGELRLYKQYYLYIKPSTYVKGLDMGERSEIAMVKSRLYIGEGSELQEFQKNKSFYMDLFGKEYNNLKAYAKANKLNFKKEADIQQIINYYNEQVLN